MGSLTLYIHPNPPALPIQLESPPHLPPPMASALESAVTSPLAPSIHYETVLVDATGSHGSHGTVE
jgi:hypothetical protein